MALTRVAHRGAPLVPVVELDTARQEWTLADCDGRPLATVTDDRVTGQTLAAPTSVTRWEEIEVELAEHGTLEVLDRVEQTLLDAGATAPKGGRSSAAYSQTGCHRRCRGQWPARTPQRGTWCWPTCGSRPTRSARRTLWVRQNAPDSVHAMRVACRRMRSTLQSFRVVLERERTDRPGRRAALARRPARRSRDLEVQEQRIGAAVSALPPSSPWVRLRPQTTRFFARRGADASHTADEALDSDRYLALLDAIDALLADPPLMPAADTPARVLLPTAVAKRSNGPTDLCVKRTQAAGPERDEHLHEMRKAAKRLRYAAEAIRPVRVGG